MSPLVREEDVAAHRAKREKRAAKNKVLLDRFTSPESITPLAEKLVAKFRRNVAKHGKYHAAITLDRNVHWIGRLDRSTESLAHMQYAMVEAVVRVSESPRPDLIEITFSRRSSSYGTRQVRVKLKMVGDTKGAIP